jgi:hypothetical protein
MKRFLVIATLALATTLLAMQSAFAARIYNFLPDAVFVLGGNSGSRLNNYHVLLEPGARSESLSWPGAIRMQVERNRQILCELHMGDFNMQGGNYMTVGHQGSAIVCTVCGINHNVMRQATNMTGYHWEGNSRIGC